VFRKLFFALVLVGCSAKSEVINPAPDGGHQQGHPDGGQVENPDGGTQVVGDPRSRKAQLKVKNATQLSLDLASALSLPRGELCRELGLYDCILAHNIVLSGVEPYLLRIDEPLLVSSVSSPIAVDRISLAACEKRATQDFANPGQAVLFGGLVRGEADGVEKAIQAIYDRILARDPDAHEVAALTSFRAEVSDAQQFATLACFAVASSVEFLFY